MGALIAIVAATALAGWASGEKGSGNIKEERRDVAEFRGVEIGGGIEADVTIGSERKVVIAADDNLLPLVKTRVDNGILKVWANDVRPSKTIRVTAVTPKLERVEASGGARMRAQASASKTFVAEGSGGADLEVRDINSEELNVSFSGGVDAKLAGKAKSARLEFSGGVDVDAQTLDIESAKIDACGGVKARLAVSKALSGQTSGGVAVRVKGTPSMSVNASGGSSIRSE